jgi:DNA-binding NarL/FixJ family response regulator
MHTAEEYVLQALNFGARGYLIKDAEPEELKQAVMSVAEGKTYLSPEISGHVIQAYLRRTRQSADLVKPKNAFQVLTPRQREVLQLIAEGYTCQEISEKLSISLKTAENHRYDIMQKLEIHDLPGLVRYAIRTGLTSLE